MKVFKNLLVAIASVICVSCNYANSKELSKEGTTSNVLSTKEMHENRAAHAATMLPGGKVFISGGFKKGPDGYSQLYSKTSEIFDPQSHSFMLATSMSTERCAHAATAMPDGNVLVTGGSNGHHLSSAELYNSKSGKWEALPDMKAARSGHDAILLPDNRVLIIGGSSRSETFAELFDYKSRQFVQVIPAPINLSGAASIMLKNGIVLIVGGSVNNQPVNSGLLFDPKSGTFTETGKMSIVRHKSSIALLPDGNALVVAGANNRDWKGKYKSTEIYNVQTNSFSAGPELNFERFKLMNAVITLKDGSILVSGGDKHIEILKPGAAKFETIGELEQPLYYSTSTLLKDGSTLIAGGYANDVQARNKAWIFRN
ncbi:Kelch repeat-containing protein [Segetibacter aerophilus]|uniref:Galactose oxidase n=1 Tax=Segetibacter aerophilus TaxID=670293 RepID=A0A512B713_9BACT|nr:kelch repeat-containing protein [Segetibacter aerophilus]GEO07736.1 hypothetical protein SAE01_02320 [Segetibacter aerophilus]